VSAFGFSDPGEQRWVLYAGRFVWKRQLAQMRRVDEFAQVVGAILATYRPSDSGSP
jgi:hypothetical protein